MQAEDQAGATDRIVDFLRGIGLPVTEGSVPDDCFLPGVRIHHGTLVFDRQRLQWPGDLLHEAGVSDYTIHLDRETNILFGVLTRPKDHTMASLPEHPVIKRWWAHMADIMETNPDGSPVAVPLVTLFHLD